MAFHGLVTNAQLVKIIFTFIDIYVYVSRTGTVLEIDRVENSAMHTFYGPVKSN